MEIIDPTIAKEKYNNINHLTNKVDWQLWVNFINKHSDYFIWSEETEKGKQTIANLDKVPEHFREKLLEGHNKRKAYAEYNQKKGYYEIVVQYNKEYGVISTTFMKPIREYHFQILLDMSKYLDAYLLNNGGQILEVYN
ncbi:hypothetical protein [Cytobacillus sp. IB215316]|uniref:hypothetical protein n=1 Tax=Cytobacillus sp. IB215316 TaxID=3097354 RepID=UPI002A12A939|nr:hypothetical protein [Cytobacillus sp. IB215316]MDX8363034.1 hypothetical protein [Cytobacillus sp. IB215316]